MQEKSMENWDEYYKNKHAGKYEVDEKDILDCTDPEGTGGVLIWVLGAACAAALNRTIKATRLRARKLGIE